MSGCLQFFGQFTQNRVAWRSNCWKTPMVKLFWFLGTILALALVFVLHNYQNLPVNNESFEVMEQKRIAREEEERKREEARKAAELKAKAEAEKAATLLLDTPELKNGHEVYFKKGKCITCHGKKGEGKTSQQAPRLAAQHNWYIYDSLRKFKSGERMNQKMRPYLRSLTDQDFKDVAEYLSKLPPQ